MLSNGVHAALIQGTMLLQEAQRQVRAAYFASVAGDLAFAEQELEAAVWVLATFHTFVQSGFADESRDRRN
jgi:hypothetical protein